MTPSPENLQVENFLRKTCPSTFNPLTQRTSCVYFAGHGIAEASDRAYLPPHRSLFPGELAECDYPPSRTPPRLFLRLLHQVGSPVILSRSSLGNQCEQFQPQD